MRTVSFSVACEYVAYIFQIFCQILIWRYPWKFNLYSFIYNVIGINPNDLYIIILWNIQLWFVNIISPINCFKCCCFLVFVQVILPSYSTIMLELFGLDPHGCNNLSQKHSANCLYICKYRKCGFEPSVGFGK